VTLAPLPLPVGVSSRTVETATGLSMHILEAGTRDRPLVLLLHGFPELAFSWRKIMPALADAGYWVVAPDQRGYGRTTGYDADYDGDLSAFALPRLVCDVLALVHALGRNAVHCVIGHDFGSFVAAWAAMIRPEVFQRVVLMSAPFGGPPDLNTSKSDINMKLAALPQPRKHYKRYYSTRPAASEMLRSKQGLHAFLRAYFHYKSADWSGNRPYALAGMTAEELAKLPTYYVMDLDADMAATVASGMPSAAEIAACHWLPENALSVYSAEFSRTGFQGGLQWYRCGEDPRFRRDLSVYAGKPIGVPACFIAGSSDWGYRQAPGDFERMEAGACADYRGSFLIEGAGHWVQQEQPEKTLDRILWFIT
jgi:pimeloyl-ACP methyl ester carboxylesterase